MGRVAEIVSTIREDIGVIASQTLKSWNENKVDENTRKAVMEAMLVTGLQRVVAGMTAYGDREIIDACSKVCEKMGVGLTEDIMQRLIQTARKQAAYIPEITYDGGNVSSRRAQASEKYLDRRMKTVATWSRQTAFEFGIDEIDSLIKGIQAGEILVIAGGEGSMKTSLALRGVENSLKKGLSVMFYSLDMDAGEIQERRLLTRLNYSQDFYIYLIQSGDMRCIDKAREEVNELDRGKFFLYGKEDVYATTVDEVREAVLTQRPNVLVIDYLTRLARKGQDDLSCVNEVMPEILSFTQKTRCRTVLLSQMSRASKREQASGITGGHSKGGGIVEELPQAEIELMKDFSDNPNNPELIVTVNKNRRGPSKVSFSLGVDYMSYSFTGEATRIYRNRSPKERPIWTKQQPSMQAESVTDAQADRP